MGVRRRSPEGVALAACAMVVAGRTATFSPDTAAFTATAALAHDSGFPDDGPSARADRLPVDVGLPGPAPATAGRMRRS